MQCQKKVANYTIGIDHMTMEDIDIPQEDKNKDFNKKIENICNGFQHKLIKKQQQIITKKQRLFTIVMECMLKSLSNTSFKLIYVHIQD
jgi:hypothetical protein